MKKAINSWSFKGKSIMECMLTAKEAGFDGIELGLEETGELSLTSSDQALYAILANANEIGIKIHSVACGLYWKYSLTANDAMVRQKAMDIARRQLEVASILGADGVLIVPGCVCADFIPGCEVVPYDVAYDRSLSAVGQLKATAERLQIHIGLENVWNKFLLSPLEFRNFIDTIGSPYVGAYLDIGNVIYNGYPEQWISILGERIKKIHFKDYRRAAGGIHGFVDLLSGDVDWKKVMEALGAIGYDGWASAEMIPPYAQFSDQLIYNTSAAMSRIFSA